MNNDPAARVSDTLAVTHVISGLGQGGAETFLARLSPHLRAVGIDSSIISLSGGGVNADRLLEEDFCVRILKVQSSIGDLRRLPSEISRTQPDVVLTWLPHADLIGGAAARLGGHRVVWNIRQGGNLPMAPLRHRTLMRAAVPLSRWLPDRIVCVSHTASREHIEIGFPDEKMDVIHNGFDPEGFAPSPASRLDVRQELGIPLNAPIVGHVARIDPVKDHPAAIASFRHVASKRPDVHFLMCGAGTDSDPELSAVAEASGLGSRLHRLGARSDLARLNASLDVAISSSLSEGLSNALGEAMACGVPCVSTDVGDARHLIGDTGKIVPAGRPEMIGAAVLSLIDDPRGCGNAARVRIRSHFSMAASADAYRNALARVAAQRRP